MQEVTLDGMPAVKRKKVIKKKKFIPTKGVPVEVSVRRQLSAEIGDDEPTKDQKFVLLQKYGVTAPRIDRLVTKPVWMGVSEWKRKQNDWFRATKGLVFQRPRFNRPNSTSRSSQPIPLERVEARVQQERKAGHRPWSEIRHKNPNHPSNRPQGTREFRPNSGPTRTATPRS